MSPGAKPPVLDWGCALGEPGEAWSSTWGPWSAGTRILAAISFFGGERHPVILTPGLPSRDKTDLVICFANLH